MCSLPGIPIALRVIYRKDFVRGPFHLGSFSYPVACAAVAWIGFISIAFILPSLNVSYFYVGRPGLFLNHIMFQPVNSQTLNYSVVAVGIVIIYSLGFWVISARKWVRLSMSAVVSALNH
jgi:hypothetical protein